MLFLCAISHTDSFFRFRCTVYTLLFIMVWLLFIVMCFLTRDYLSLELNCGKRQVEHKKKTASLRMNWSSGMVLFCPVTFLPRLIDTKSPSKLINGFRTWELCFQISDTERDWFLCYISCRVVCVCHAHKWHGKSPYTKSDGRLMDFHWNLHWMCRSSLIIFKFDDTEKVSTGWWTVQMKWLFHLKSCFTIHMFR